MLLRILLPVLSLATATAPAAAQQRFTVEPVRIADEKAVFATIESTNVIAARARLDGTVTELRVDEGVEVAQGEVIAVVVAGQLDPQIAAMGAQVSAAEAELAQARTDLARAEALVERDAAPRAQLDAARTQVSVLERRVDALRQERDVVQQRAREGDVLAPSGGRVLRVPVTEGAVVRPGETIAEIGVQARVLRLRVPERHARAIAVGDPVRVDGATLTGGVAAEGQIVQVYPEIEDGRVVADAQVAGLGDFFAGERVRVRIAVDEREAILIPRSFVSTRFGVDYVRVAHGGGAAADVPVQLGGARDGADGAEMVEILSGLGAGDVLTAP